MRTVRLVAGVGLCLVGVAMIGWGIRTFLVYVVRVGDVYRDSQPQAFIPLIAVCLILGAGVVWAGGNLLRQRHR